jgi:hypothetical protein
MVDPSFYDARHSEKTAGAALLGCNAKRPVAAWKVYVTGCLGNVEWILR